MFNKKIILILTIIIVSLLAISAVSAADNNTSNVVSVEETTDEVVSVEDTTDDVVSVEETTDAISVDENQVIVQLENNSIIGVDDGTFTALQNKIDNSKEGSTITLENDYTYDEDFKILGITIDKPLTINGNGHTINALDKSRIFFIEGENVVLKNIKFCNANDHGYGEDNGGGAIKWKGSNGVLSDCSFDNSNTPDFGGAVFWLGDNGVLRGSSFVDSNAYYAGGAVCWFGSSGVLSDCSFVDSKSKSNSDNGDGGAVCWSGDNGALSNCSFVDSSAHKGGAVDWDGANGILCDCNFLNSLAFKNRQGNYIGEGCDVFWSGSDGILRDCNFSNAFSNEAAGDVYWKGSNGVLSDCSFMNSYVYDGGAIYWTGNNGNLSDCSFVNCSTYASWYGGSAVYWSASSGDLHSCSFMNCSAKYGGAVYWHGANGVLSDCSFVDCSAIYRGGAVYWIRDNGVLSNCTFINNSAGYGGAIYAFGSDCAVENSVFVNNSATTSGSAVYMNDISSFNDNWWGSNNPDWDELTDNNKPSSYAVLTGSTNTITITPGSKAKLNYAFYRNGTNNLLYLPARPIELSTTGGQLDNTSGYLINEFSTEFSSNNIGNYEITATVDNQEVKLNVTVNKIDKIDTTLTIPDVIVIGNSTGVVVATLKDCYGDVVSGVNVKIVVGDLSKVAKTNKNGRVSLDISGLAPGKYTISARSSATSAIYKEARTTAKAIVSADKLDTTLTVPDVVVVGDSTGVVVATLKDSYGNVVSGVNVKIVVGKLSVIAKTNKKGQVSLDISSLSPGQYTVSARSSATSAIYKEARTTAKAIVSEDKLDTTLTVPDVVVVGDSTGNVVATLKDCYGNVVSGVNVKIVVGGLSVIAKTNKNGRVSLDISSLAPGMYTISARSSATSEIYKESRTTAKAIVSEDKLDTTLTIPDVIVAGNSTGVVVATLKDSYGNIVRGVNVKIVVGDLSIIDATDENGQVSLDISSLKPGEYTISARSSRQTDIYNEARATAKAIVSEGKIKTVLTAAGVTTTHNSGKKLVATLKDSYGNAVAGVKVRITAGTLDKISKTNSKGQVGLDVSTLDAGTYTATIKSAATDVYVASKTTASVQIKP